MEEIINSQDIKLETISNQIIKDLTLSGLETDAFENLSSPTDLANALKNLVSEMLTYRYEDFNRFMYRIDIPESKLSNLLHRDLASLVDELCVLILKREMQKIIFRQQFGA